MKFDYTVAYIPRTVDLMKELNSFGEEGWELVGNPVPVVGDSLDDTTLVAFFKKTVKGKK